MHGERLLKGCLTAVVLSVSMLASLSAPAVAVGGAASAGGEPLAIVMDLSDSMNEDDGTGTVKLDGAKEALVSLTQSQASRGQRLGLWTYPGGATIGGCEAGGWLTPVGYQNPGLLSATINSLTAVSGTPTGPALRAAADSLKAAGHNPAVILLVSDGMSNCGPPPCDVAKELVADGFDLTVQAMGFQVDEAGREELACVAQATNGTYYDATDVDDLIDKIEEYSIPKLRLEVNAPTSVASGDVVSVSATVSNDSTQDIPDVSVTMVPRNGDAQSIFPAVVPPRVRLGNIPRGSSREYTWQLPIGSFGKGGVATFGITAASSQNVGAVSRNIEVQALGPESNTRPSTWLSDVVADGSAARIAIFGDSYSAGEGGGAYDLTTAQRDVNECHRSSKTYVAGAGLDVINVACSGATTTNVTAWGQYNESAQVTEFAEVDSVEPVEAAFMTIGGNDIGFADILTQCIVGSDLAINPQLACDEAYAHKPAETAMLKQPLAHTYKQVYAAINTPDQLEERGRFAPLIILPYPNVVPARASGECGMDNDELRFGQLLVNNLNAAIEETVNELHAAEGYDGIIFASSVRTALGTHGFCSETSHMHNPTIAGAGSDTLFNSWDKAKWGHPTAEGYMDTTRAIQAWAFTQTIDPAMLVPPVEVLRMFVDEMNDDAAHSPVDVDSFGASVARAGDAVRVTGSGFAPNSPVIVSVSSWRYALGTADANERGEVDTVVGIPPYVPVGSHHLVVEGVDAGMQPLEKSVSLRVANPAPWWLGPAAYISAGLVVLGLVLLMARRLRTRPGS